MPTNDVILDPMVEKSLRASHDKLAQQGKLLTKEKLAECYALFRTRFGPEVLAKLDGEQLLNFIHARPSKDSLVYWLEFKNDNEFSDRFGSISGGTSLKFGVYWRQESGQWMIGSSKNQQPTTTAEAITIATKQRDQLLAAVGLLETFPKEATDADYAKLQQQMDQLAPDVSSYAWGHKYLSLLFPDILDDYHNPDYQKHHLIKILVPPAEQDGMYASAGKLVRVAKELGWLMNHLTTVLNHRDGNPVNYWRIGTRLGEGAEAQDIWPAMKNGGYIAIGWPELGDLSTLVEDKAAKEKIAPLLAEQQGYNQSVATRKAGEIRNFIKDISEGDVVIAAAGERILGVGRVEEGDYEFSATPPKEAPHRRKVVWHECPEWKLPVTEGLRTTVCRLKESDANLIEIEKRLLGPQTKTEPPNTLAAPFNEFFASFDEANQGFDFIKDTFVKLVIDPAQHQNDKRICLSLAGGKKEGDRLRLNFGNWALLTFENVSLGENRLHYLCRVDHIPKTSKHTGQEYDFSDKVDGHTLGSASSSLKSLTDVASDERKAFEEGLTYAAKRFSTWKAGLWPVNHRPELLQMVYDLGFRHKVLNAGLKLDAGSSPGPVLDSDGPPPASNTILYGPPGTGKTYKTIERAVHIIEPNFTGDHSAYKARFDALRAMGQIEFITFHQSYSYEDFVEGLRPVIEGPESSEAAYEYSAGVFKRFSFRALFDCLKPAAGIISFDAVWKKLVEQSELEPDKSYPGLTEKASYHISLSTKGNLEGINTISNKTFLCSRSVLEQVFTARPETDKVTSSEVMEVVARGCHSHFVAAMFNELKRIAKSEFTKKGSSPNAGISPEQKESVVQAFLAKTNPATAAFRPASEWPRYVLVIDEINRGNISKILGELITLIEPDKRIGAENSLVVTLPYTKHSFAVPANLHILGTMNTADKSIALVDVALRRRFEFVELRPDFNLCEKLTPPMRAVLETLNRRICLRKDRDHQVGHSYFMKVADAPGFNRVFARHVVPLLQEYFYNDWDGLRFVLGVKHQPDKLIIPLKDGDSGDSRSSWQWSFEAGNTSVNDMDFLQVLGGNGSAT